MNESADNWQTIADFAAARGCSIRTVKRWIESGTVESRKDGARRLVRDQKEGHKGTQERDTEGHNRDTEEGHEGTQAPRPRSEVGTQQGHRVTQKRDTEGTQAPHVETDLRAQLDRAHAEISFLRNVIEGQQRGRRRDAPGTKARARFSTQAVDGGRGATNRHRCPAARRNRRGGQPQPDQCARPTDTSQRTEIGAHYLRFNRRRVRAP